MKKTRIILILLAALLCLSACGSKSSTPADEPEFIDPTDFTGTDDTKEGIGRGEISGNTYRNDYVGLTVTLPDGWSFYDDEQIATVNNMTLENFKDTKMEETLKESGQVIDMFAVSNNQASNINVLITTGGLAIAGVSDEQIFTLMEDVYKEQLEGSNMTIKDYQVLKTTKNGKEKAYLCMKVELEGVSFDEYQIYVRTNSDYIGIVTITLMEGEDFEPILNTLNW